MVVLNNGIELLAQGKVELGWKSVDTVAHAGTDGNSDAAFNRLELRQSLIVQAGFQPVICEASADTEQNKRKVLQLVSQLKL